MTKFTIKRMKSKNQLQVPYIPVSMDFAIVKDIHFRYTSGSMKLHHLAKIYESSIETVRKVIKQYDLYLRLTKTNPVAKKQLDEEIRRREEKVKLMKSISPGGDYYNLDRFDKGEKS